jgi:hypothetical protein
MKSCQESEVLNDLKIQEEEEKRNCTNNDIRNGQPECSMMHGMLGGCHSWFICMENCV